MAAAWQTFTKLPPSPWPAGSQDAAFEKNLREGTGELGNRSQLRDEWKCLRTRHANAGHGPRRAHDPLAYIHDLLKAHDIA